MMKDDERKLYFAYCPPEMQTVPRETRRVVWETRMSFNAVGILTDEETLHFVPDFCWEASFCQEQEQLKGVTQNLNHIKLVSQHWHLVTR